jgi:pilus assembly protein CpaC
MLYPAVAMAQPAPLAVAPTAPVISPTYQDPADAPIVKTDHTPPPKPYYGGLGIEKGMGKEVKLPHPVSNVFVSNPSVVEVRPASQDSLFLFGKDLGRTTVETTDSDGHVIAEYTVTVTPSQYAAAMVNAGAPSIARNSSVTATSEPNGMVITGTVQSPVDAENIVNQAKASTSGPVINDLQVQQPVQVELKVRIASMQRSVTRQLGIDWSSVSTSGFNIGKFLLSGATNTGSPTTSGTTPANLGLQFPGGTLEGVIDALATDNLAHIMAEPTLTTLSGTTANFIVGGQFPIPISESNGQATIEFKNYGVQLTFTPTVYSNGEIALAVSPQVSQLSDANSVTLSGSGGSTASIVVPSLVSSGTSSTVILGSGQGMAIAGLLEDTSNQTDNSLPGLGEIPIVGALFRGDSYTREQQELVITVTPYLVTPNSSPGLIASPDDGWTPPNDLQRILLLQDNGTRKNTGTVPGDAGFIVQ